MNGQVLCHNEFTIVGRVSDEMKNMDSGCRVLILCPNDDDYQDVQSL